VTAAVAEWDLVRDGRARQMVRRISADAVSLPRGRPASWSRNAGAVASISLSKALCHGMTVTEICGNDDLAPNDTSGSVDLGGCHARKLADDGNGLGSAPWGGS